MGFIEIAALIIFLATITVVITGWFDSVIAALIGVTAMICFGVMSDLDAFKAVDWNLIAILLSIWIISGFFGKSGVPEYLSALVLRASKGNVALFAKVWGECSRCPKFFKCDEVGMVLEI